MLPQIVQPQTFLNSADLDWSVVIRSTGDFPPAGKFIAHMKADLTLSKPDKVWSEDNGGLVRGTADGAAATLVLRFVALADEINPFFGSYRVHLYYVRGGAKKSVMQTDFVFERGA